MYLLDAMKWQLVWNEIGLLSIKYPIRCKMSIYAIHAIQIEYDLRDKQMKFVSRVKVLPDRKGGDATGQYNIVRKGQNV